LEIAPFNRSHTSSYSSANVPMAISCTIFEIKQGIGRKTPIFHIPLFQTPFMLAPSPRTPWNFCPKF